MKRILAILLLLPNLAFAQISQSTIVNDITANLPTNNQNLISAELLRNTLNAMTSAIFQAQGLNGLTISGTPVAGQVLIATGSAAASWQTFGNGVSCPANTVVLTTFTVVNGIVTHC